MAKGTAMAKKTGRAHVLRWLLLVAAVLAILYLAINWPHWRERAQVATGFGSRIACSCRYIDGRDLKSCESDFSGLEGMGLVRFTDDPTHRAVQASVPLLARRGATFRQGYGCMADKLE
jgi:hypothetical protein